MPDKTVERTTRRDGPDGAGGGSARAVDHLFLVVEGARPLGGGARWSLEGLDEVRVRRGSSRASARERDGARRVLSIKLPDALLSSSHGRLVRSAGGWTLVDDRSTNGTLIDGARIEARALGDGACFEMGAAHFILRLAMPTPEGTADELESASLLGRTYGVASLVPAYANELARFARVAMSGLSILLLGESGTGKEVLAAAAHRLSGRGGPFVPVNCGALTATLMESQLFGHTKGAFSGALRDEPGFVRASDGGTLFLDEIGDLPAASQAALLRVLETREVVPVGSTRAVAVDLRVVSATLRSVGSLRPDLHARLAGFTHTLWPLRDRMEDLGVILAELIARAAGDRAASVRLSPEAGRALLAHDWPLNVRELNQALGVALALAPAVTLQDTDFPTSVRRGVEEIAHAAPAAASPPTPPAAAPAPIPQDDASLRALLVATLTHSKGNVSEVSRALGKTRMQIHRWMRRFGVDPETFRT